MMSRSSVRWRSSVDGILDILGKRMYHCSPRTSRRLEFGIRNLEFGISHVLKRPIVGDLRAIRAGSRSAIRIGQHEVEPEILGPDARRGTLERDVPTNRGSLRPAKRQARDVGLRHLEELAAE